MPPTLPPNSNNKTEIINWPKSEGVKEDKIEEDKVKEEVKEEDDDSNSDAPSRFYRPVLDYSNKKSTNSSPTS
jgi:hypothetical protein